MDPFWNEFYDYGEEYPSKIVVEAEQSSVQRKKVHTEVLPDLIGHLLICRAHETHATKWPQGMHATRFSSWIQMTQGFEMALFDASFVCVIGDVPCLCSSESDAFVAVGTWLCRAFLDAIKASRNTRSQQTRIGRGQYLLALGSLASYHSEQQYSLHSRRCARLAFGERGKRCKDHFQRHGMHLEIDNSKEKRRVPLVWSLFTYGSIGTDLPNNAWWSMLGNPKSTIVVRRANPVEQPPNAKAYSRAVFVVVWYWLVLNTEREYWERKGVSDRACLVEIRESFETDHHRTVVGHKHSVETIARVQSLDYRSVPTFATIRCNRSKWQSSAYQCRRIPLERDRRQMVKLLSTSWWTMHVAGESLHMTRVVNIWDYFITRWQCRLLFGTITIVVRIHCWTKIEIDRMRSVATFQFRFHKSAVRWKGLMDLARIVEMQFPLFTNQIAIETNCSISNIAKLKSSFYHSFSGWIGMRPGWEGRDSDLIKTFVSDLSLFRFLYP